MHTVYWKLDAKLLINGMDIILFSIRACICPMYKVNQIISHERLLGNIIWDIYWKRNMPHQIWFWIRLNSLFLKKEQTYRQHSQYNLYFSVFENLDLTFEPNFFDWLLSKSVCLTSTWAIPDFRPLSRYLYRAVWKLTTVNGFLQRPPLISPIIFLPNVS